MDEIDKTRLPLDALMTLEDGRLVLAAVVGILVAVLLIVRGRLHPFVALLCGAFLIGPLAGHSVEDTAKAVQQGAGDILGGVGLVVALGLALGTMLQLSDGAAGLARMILGSADRPQAPWTSLLVALLIGLPLFFETGLVLLLPIIASAQTTLGDARSRDGRKLGLMLTAVGGLSVVHGLVPPHPGPLIAVNALGADLGRTLTYGLLVGVPTAIVVGPLFAMYAARQVAYTPAPGSAAAGSCSTVLEDAPVGRALLVVLLPVGLIVAGQLIALLPAGMAAQLKPVAALGHPVLALLLACLVALPLLFGRRLRDPALSQEIWTRTVEPAGAILLAIGAGGALKQVLVSAGFSHLLERLASSGALSPILLGWLIAVAIRLATGSATVATITAAGIMPQAIAGSGASPEWTVLAIGAGSLFFSHVNDPGFWLVKSYLGIDTPTTFRTWSLMETLVSVVGLTLVLLMSHLL